MLQLPAQSPLLGEKTMYRARDMGIQHANMSRENDTRHLPCFDGLMLVFEPDLTGVTTISTKKHRFQIVSAKLYMQKMRIKHEYM